MGYRIKAQILALLMTGIFLFVIPGCDSGQKAVDEVTGNRALKQYHQAKDDIKKIEDQQKERYDQIDEDQSPEKQMNQENN